MDAFDSTKPDRFQQALGNAWASFLSAQHCSHEINALKRALDEHARQADSSVSSLQRDISHQHDLLRTEIRSKIEQNATESETLRNRLFSLQQDVNQDREHTATKLAELSSKVSAQQECLDGVRSTAAQDLSAVQEQYRLALEKVELLQAELRELRAERMASEQRVTALEHRIASIAQPRQGLTEEGASFLSEILPRQDGLMRLLDKHSCWDVSHPNLGQPVPGAGTLRPQPPPRPGISNSLDKNENARPAKPTRTPPVPPPQPQAKPPVPPPQTQQDIRALYLVFRDRYKASPPRSDVDFIWEFIGSIESPALSEHVQESLAALLPEYVTRSRDTRRKDPLRHVTISRGLTWRRFREALVKVPTP